VAEEKDKKRRTLWVLETQTKGTGANMVPLDKVLRKPGSDTVPGFAFRKPQPRESEPPQPREPYRFKVVDLMTREVLAEGVDARTAVDVLEDVHSIMDVIAYVWEPETERWRMLTFAETSALWDFRGADEDREPDRAQQR
jgi:hypothetical protein